MRFIILLIIILNLHSVELIISYKAIVKNQILVSEEYNVIKVLNKSKEFTLIGNCDFVDSSNLHESLTLQNNNEFNNLNESQTIQILKNNKDEILECLQKNINTKIRDDSKFINNILVSRIKFEIPAQRIIAIENNNKIEIKIIEKIK